MADSALSDRRTLIEVVQTPLGFLVLLTLILEGVLLFLLRDVEPADRLPLIWTMLGLLGVVLALVVALAVAI